MRYEIPDEVRRLAIRYHEEVTGKKVRANYTALERPFRYAVGFVGEWMVASHLKRLGVPVSWNSSATRGYQAGDVFVRWHGGKIIRLEVKSRDRMDATRFFYNREQYRRKKGQADLIIGCRTNLQEGEILSVADEPAVADWPVDEQMESPAHAQRFDKLPAFGQWMNRLLHGLRRKNAAVPSAAEATQQSLGF